MIKIIVKCDSEYSILKADDDTNIFDFVVNKYNDFISSNLFNIKSEAVFDSVVSVVGYLKEDDSFVGMSYSFKLGNKFSGLKKYYFDCIKYKFGGDKDEKRQDNK